MKTANFATIVALSVLCVSPSFADELTGTRSNGPSDIVNSKARPAAVPSVATPTAEAFQSVVIPAGQNVALDSSLDYSSAATVAVTVQCTVCVSSTTSLASAGLILQARWQVSDSTSFVATENKPATAFPYFDSGGAIFNVYAPQFRLNLQNKGTQPIVLQQVTIFRRSQ